MAYPERLESLPKRDWSTSPNTKKYVSISISGLSTAQNAPPKDPL